MGWGKKKMHWWILLGAVAGAAAGSVVYFDNLPQARAQVLGPRYTAEQAVEKAASVNEVLAERIADTSFYRAVFGIKEIFMRLLKMIVIPLVIFSLIAGVSRMDSIGHLGRIGAKTVLWYLSTSLIAIVTGLLLVNALQPGAGVDLRMPAIESNGEMPGSFWDVLVNMVPRNPVEAMVSYNLIGVIFFALLFAVFLLSVEPGKRKPMADFCEAGAEVMINMTWFVVALAPLGVAALLAETVAKTGPVIFLSMLGYMGTVLLSLSIHFFLTLPLLIYVFTRLNPFGYMKTMAPALLTAFSTASSSGTLGVTMERAERGAGIPRRVASFVLPLGATINMDGTALYEIVTVLFIAQVHAGLDPTFSLSFGQQLLICFIGLMVSIGAAGIPHAGLVMMVIILQAVGLPVEYTGLVWAVDRVLDMCRTAVNVWSDSAIAFVVSHAEGEAVGPAAKAGGMPKRRR